MRGKAAGLVTNLTIAEFTLSDPYNLHLDYMDGLLDNFAYYNGTVTTPMIYWLFRRAPGFFDVVAYTGDGVAGRTVPHNLGVAPEMMIMKPRNDTGGWFTYVEPLGNAEALQLNLTNSALGFGYWNNTTPTDTVFTIGGGSNNDSGINYIAYLFATLPGVSKVGSYTGNGTSQTINCGFTSGARFVLIKRTDSTGDWWVLDSARGIVAGDDPYLALNTTAAEQNDPFLAPNSSGFTLDTANGNASGGNYIFLAIA